MVKHICLTIFTSISLAIGLQAQGKLSSPISILGFGQILDQDHAFVQSIGGINASFHSPDRLNIGNPASLAHLKTTIFAGGLTGSRTRLDDGRQTGSTWNGNMGYLSLGMPLQNQFNAIFNRKDPKIKWGMNFQLSPYSVAGYQFVDTEEISSGANVDTIQRFFKGEGSTYILSWSNGFKYKNLSLGFTVGHLFGALENDRTALFPLNETGGGFSFQTRASERHNFRSFVWNTGAMYDIVFDYIERADGSKGDPNKYLTLGLTYHSEWSIRSETDQAIIRENLNTSPIGTIDTLSSTQDLEGSGQLPGEIGVGVSYSYKKIWRAGLNYRHSAWSKFDNPIIGQTQNTKDAFKFSGGFALTPNPTSITSFFDRVTYSFGFFYEKDPRVLQGEQIENYGAKIGFTFPIVGQRQVSHVNLNLGYGRLGVGNGYKENYFSFGLGYALSDNKWFIKRKYD